MADQYEVVSTYEDVEFLGGSNTRDVIVAGVRTKPHGIYLEVRVPKSHLEKGGAGLIGAVALSWSQVFEDLLRVPHVAGVQWGQDTHNGQLQDVAIIDVQSASGDSEATLTIPVLDLGPKLGAQRIAALSGQLDAIEGL